MHYAPTMTTRLLRASLIGCVIASAGCEKAAPSTNPSEAPAASTSTSMPKPLAFEDEDPHAVTSGEGDSVKLQLPPSPVFVEANAPKQYSDGAFSINGLRHEIDANVQDGDAGVEIRLRAYVLEVYVPPECLDVEGCPPAKQPHVWVVDDPGQRGKRQAMMVTNYRFPTPEWDAKRWKGQSDVILEAGKQYTFKGKFKRFSDTGFASDRGLLEFIAYEQPASGGGTRWVYPPSAPWHPLEVARMEEENAAMTEKAWPAVERRGPNKGRPKGR